MSSIIGLEGFEDLEVPEGTSVFSIVFNHLNTINRCIAVILEECMKSQTSSYLDYLLEYIQGIHASHVRILDSIIGVNIQDEFTEDQVMIMFDAAISLTEKCVKRVKQVHRQHFSRISAQKLGIPIGLVKTRMTAIMLNSQKS